MRTSGTPVCLALPSVFGDPYDPGRRYEPDQVEVTILKTAYQRAPVRFRECLGWLIKLRDESGLKGPILETVAPVWDSEIASFLLAQLRNDRFSPRTFRRILAALLQAGDPLAAEIAASLVADAANAPLGEIDKPIAAALEMLETNLSGGWPIVWAAANASAAFAEKLSGEIIMRHDPYWTTQILKGLCEHEVKELVILLERHHARRLARRGRDTWLFSPTFQDSNSLCGVVMVNLVNRGTVAATDAIRKLKDIFPDETLDGFEEAAREHMRQKTWTPPSPSDLLAWALDGACNKEESAQRWQGTQRAEDRQSPRG
jgi:hypothetical protein